MRLDPAIAALQSDPGLQRRAQQATFAACKAWRDTPETASLLEELERFGGGAPLEACAALEALFTMPGEGTLALNLCRALCAALGAEPFGHPPLRHGYDGRVSSLLLARSGRAHLTLVAREPGADATDRVALSDAVRFEAFLAGAGRGRIVRLGTGAFDCEPIALRGGARLAFDLSSEALQVIETHRRLVSLRLHRTAAEPMPTREYAVADAALVHQSGGDLAASRREMMVAVLGRMKVAAAVPEMAAIACAPGDRSLRWQALRECLALDTEQGYRALLAVARAADDPLCGAAGALRAQLIEAHPALLALERG